MRLCCVWFPFFFPRSYDMKELQLGLVGGEPVIEFFFLYFSVFCLFFIVELPVAAPPGEHDSDATTARFIL